MGSLSETLESKGMVLKADKKKKNSDFTNCNRCFKHTPGVIAHSVRVLHGKDQTALKIESRYTKESVIASRICTQCSAASGIFITNQKRLVTVSHLLESLLAAMAVALEQEH